MLCEILSLEQKESREIIAALFTYYFGRISQKQFEKIIGDRKRALAIKAASKRSGYVLKNCKLFAYAHYSAKLKGEKLPKARDYGVAVEDAKILRRLNLAHLDVDTYPAFTLKEFEYVINKLCSSSELKTHIGKLVSKKMMFLIKSYGVTRSDITLELYEAAISVAYRTYPMYESYLHFVNIAKANIHSIAHSMIHFYTAKSRQRLQKTEHGGHEAVNVDIGTLADIAAPENYGDELKEQIKAIEKAQNALNVKPQQRNFLLCLAGQRNESFSEFLGTPNDEAVERMSYPNYMKKAMAYFEMTPAKTERLFERLRQEMLGTPL
jgi:hypothetical protein